MDRYCFKVVYTDCSSDLQAAYFEELSMGTDALMDLVKRDYPDWGIIRIDRGIKQSTSPTSALK